MNAFHQGIELVQNLAFEIGFDLVTEQNLRPRLGVPLRT